ncbi:hypothetical protein TNCV_2415281 [Trichonephila clavipes]|nr:hypothetical protein TNCV_2415281 [Trichonephila clavipes]
MNKSDQTMSLSFLKAAGCQSGMRSVHRWWVMEGLTIKKTKKGIRVRELRKIPSRTKTGKVRAGGLREEGGALEIVGGQQFEVPRVPGRLKMALQIPLVV